MWYQELTVYNGPFNQPRLKIKWDEYNIVCPNGIITERLLNMFIKGISHCSVAGLKYIGI